MGESLDKAVKELCYRASNVVKNEVELVILPEIAEFLQEAAQKSEHLSDKEYRRRVRDVWTVGQ